jgi:hypothetical protein
MSDLMLHGVLNMPPELWGDDALDKMQRHSRYVEASKVIEELKNIAQETVSYISKRSYQSQFGDGIVVEINENLNKLLDKLDELSQ